MSVFATLHGIVTLYLLRWLSAQQLHIRSQHLQDAAPGLPRVAGAAEQAPVRRQAAEGVEPPEVAQQPRQRAAAGRGRRQHQELHARDVLSSPCTGSCCG
jgi:hypothetical protein